MVGVNSPPFNVGVKSERVGVKSERVGVNSPPSKVGVNSDTFSAQCS